MTKSLLPLMSVVGILLVGAGSAEAQPAVEVFQDRSSFEAATEAVDVPFPADADTALPLLPFAGMTGYSCDLDDPGLDFGMVRVSAPNAQVWICLFDEDWNAGSINIDPQPTGTTIVASGEDDFLVALAEPTDAIGFGLLTNHAAAQTVTLNLVDGTSIVIEDTKLNTEANSFNFIGFRTGTPITSALIDTTEGWVQNAGITAIVLGSDDPEGDNSGGDPEGDDPEGNPQGDDAEVGVDIKPGSSDNCLNPEARGVLPVAVLSSADFDATTVDPTSVSLEGSPARPHGRSGRIGTIKDVDHDGHLDLLLHIEDLGGLADLTEATLTGSTFDGTSVHGTDHVCQVPRRVASDPLPTGEIGPDPPTNGHETHPGGGSRGHSRGK